MSFLSGSIDDLRRPLVRVEAPEFIDPLVAFIDTGFNGAIIIDAAQAARLSFRITRQEINARLASQRDEQFLLARGQFPWFGKQVPITAFVLIETPRAQAARRAQKREEEVLIGTELLAGCRVELDFPARTVVIAQDD